MSVARKIIETVTSEIKEFIIYKRDELQKVFEQPDVVQQEETESQIPIEEPNPYPEEDK